MKTGIARLLAGTGERVQGLVLPNDATSTQRRRRRRAEARPGRGAEMRPHRGGPAAHADAATDLRVVCGRRAGWSRAASARPTRSARWCGT